MSAPAPTPHRLCRQHLCRSPRFLPHISPTRRRGLRPSCPIAIKTSIRSQRRRYQRRADVHYHQDENWLQIIGGRFGRLGLAVPAPVEPRPVRVAPVHGESQAHRRRQRGVQRLFSSAYHLFPRGDESLSSRRPTRDHHGDGIGGAHCSRFVRCLPASAVPAGGATEAKQDTGNATLVSILGQPDSKTSTQATASAQTTGNNSLSSIDGKVATAAKQDTGNASLQQSPRNRRTGRRRRRLRQRVADWRGDWQQSNRHRYGGDPSADVLSVQGVVGGTPQPIRLRPCRYLRGAATETTLALLTVAQNSTTGGQSGPLMMGAVTTSAPNYLNNARNPSRWTPRAECAWLATTPQ